MGFYVFPTFLFNPTSIRPTLVGASLAGGQTLAGDLQYADLSGGGRWVVEFGETALLTPTQIKLWRALSAVADGGATPIIVPLGDRRNSALTNHKFTGTSRLGYEIYNDNGDSPPWWTPEEIVAAATSDIALRATQVEFSDGGATLIGGEHFSVEHPNMGWRLYRIVRVISQSGGNVVADIRPPMREAVTTGDWLNFENPCCLMRVDGDMDLTVDFLSRSGRASARFVETFAPLS